MAGSRSEGATPARRAALQVMRAVRAGDLADRALERAAGDLPSRDYAWTQELVYGTFRLRGRIDFLLEELASGGLARLEPDVLDVLRLGAYQLLEMGSVPPYAAISQSVELARAAGAGRASGLVNGVLHSLQRKRDALRFPDPDRDPLGHLTHWGSHPRWLAERWLQRWGLDAARRLVEANNRRPELYIRPVGCDVAEASRRLSAAGVAVEAVEFAPDCLRVLAPAGAREALATVPAVVQDPAAALVVSYAAVPAGARVLDLCAAPGGKAIGMTESASYVVAADASLGRLGRLRENLDRLDRWGRAGVVVADARQPPFRPADLVLIDAPCTGTGTLRRHPDGRWRIDPQQLGELVRLQEEILQAAAPLVRPGGHLVYSTCSLEREENEEQVARFLQRNPTFALDPATGAVDADLLTPEGMLSVLPQLHHVDGSFAARLRRVD